MNLRGFLGKLWSLNFQSIQLIIILYLYLEKLVCWVSKTWPTDQSSWSIIKGELKGMAIIFPIPAERKIIVHKIQVTWIGAYLPVIDVYGGLITTIAIFRVRFCPGGWTLLLVIPRWSQALNVKNLSKFSAPTFSMAAIFGYKHDPPQIVCNKTLLHVTS